MERPDLEAIRATWGANSLYVAGSVMDDDVVLPEYYLTEKSVGDALLAYITCLESQLQTARDALVEIASSCDIEDPDTRPCHRCNGREFGDCDQDIAYNALKELGE